MSRAEQIQYRELVLEITYSNDVTSADRELALDLLKEVADIARTYVRFREPRIRALVDKFVLSLEFTFEELDANFFLTLAELLEYTPINKVLVQDSRVRVSLDLGAGYIVREVVRCGPWRTEVREESSGG